MKNATLKIIGQDHDALRLNAIKIGEIEEYIDEYITKNPKSFSNADEQYNDVHEFLNEFLAECPGTFRVNAIAIGAGYANEKGYDVEHIREELSNALNKECLFATFKSLDEFFKQLNSLWA